MRNHVVNAIIYLGAMLIVAAVLDYTGAEVEYYNRMSDEASARMSVAGEGNFLAKHAVMYAPASTETRIDARNGEIEGPAGYDLEQVVPQGCYGERGYLMRDKRNRGVHVFMRWIRTENRWEKYGHTIREAFATEGVREDDVVIPGRFVFKGVVMLDCRESIKFEVIDVMNYSALALLRYVPGRVDHWVVESSVPAHHEEVQ